MDFLVSGMNSLASGMNSLAPGLDSLASGIDSLASGMDSLAPGMDSLSSGMDSLMDSLMSWMDSLASGSCQIVVPEPFSKDQRVFPYFYYNFDTVFKLTDGKRVSTTQEEFDNDYLCNFTYTTAQSFNTRPKLSHSLGFTKYFRWTVLSNVKMHQGLGSMPHFVLKWKGIYFDLRWVIFQKININWFFRIIISTLIFYSINVVYMRKLNQEV